MMSVAPLVKIHLSITGVKEGWIDRAIVLRGRFLRVT